MRLTRYTDNALRCLTMLALHPGEAATVADISRRMHMSEDHVFKVVQGLTAGGYVTTQRGRNGGVTLARAADKIRVGAVVRHTEENFRLVECFDPETNECPITKACELSGALDRALKAFLAVLNEVTLADLVEKPRRIERLLSA